MIFQELLDWDNNEGQEQDKLMDEEEKREAEKWKNIGK